MIRVLVPIKTISELNARCHWAARARRAKVHRESTYWALISCGVGMLPCSVTMTRLGAKDLDGDNLQGSLKATRDGVADWLKVADSDPRVTWIYAQRRPARRGTYAVEIEVRPCAQAAGG
ncbi:hypothetical protein [Ramlibacter sp.]|uniref:hypothetical protein n=1 Tax=Ramlibacter sp. TaxID=1917967 RepID=UPI002FC7B1EE